jgi:hypothetical protein
LGALSRWPSISVATMPTVPSSATRWIEGATCRAARHSPAVPPFWVRYTSPSEPTMQAFGPPPQSTSVPDWPVRGSQTPIALAYVST